MVGAKEQVRSHGLGGFTWSLGLHVMGKEAHPAPQETPECFGLSRGRSARLTSTRSQLKQAENTKAVCEQNPSRQMHVKPGVLCIACSHYKCPCTSTSSRNQLICQVDGGSTKPKPYDAVCCNQGADKFNNAATLYLASLTSKIPRAHCS